MDWRALEQQVDRTMNTAFGENVRLVFKADSVVDPDRPAVEVRAILHVDADQLASFGEGMKTRTTSSTAELLIDRAAYSGPAIRSGDSVRAVTRVGQPWFSVVRVSDRDTSLLRVTLTGV